MSRIPVKVHNADIALVFEQIADLLDIEEANPFRIRAYRNAARTVSQYPEELPALVLRGESLPKIRGIGVDLGAKIVEIANTGHCSLLDRLRNEVPPTLVGLLEITGLGPRRVRALYHELGITNREELLDAAQQGRVRHLHGFGSKLEQRIVAAIGQQMLAGIRVPRVAVLPVAGELAAFLQSQPGVKQVEVAGSVRRACETVGDIDVVVCAARGSPVCRSFVRYQGVDRVLSAGSTRSSVLLASGLQVDLRVVKPESFGAALLYFTGSKGHSIALRARARRYGLKLNEYGVFKGARRLAGTTEKSMYRAIDLPFIEPELRENRGEIEAALAGDLPRLLRRRDLRGDLHVHTSASDGYADILTMARSARAAGLEYIAITDHSQRLKMARGLDARRVKKQLDEIDALQRQHDIGLTILKGIEVDILKDGSLDLPDKLLQRLDIVIGAVHSHFDLSARAQTRRVLRALAHPLLRILAHPTGRLLGKRPPYEMDVEAVLQGAAENRCAMELNAQPDRLDLNDVHCQSARALGVPVCVNSDAHSPADFRHLELGVAQARRGWLSRADVLNTKSLDELQSWLKGPMSRGPDSGTAAEGRRR